MHMTQLIIKCMSYKQTLCKLHFCLKKIFMFIGFVYKLIVTKQLFINFPVSKKYIVHLTLKTDWQTVPWEKL